LKVPASSRKISRLVSKKQRIMIFIENKSGGEK